MVERRTKEYYPRLATITLRDAVQMSHIWDILSVTGFLLILSLIMHWLHCYLSQMKGNTISNLKPEGKYLNVDFRVGAIFEDVFWG